MSPRRHVLVVEQGPAAARSKQDYTPSKHPDVVARVVTTVAEAVHELQQAGYDAVYLRVDSAEELALVLRIKNTVPEVPVCALTPPLRPELDRLARESGADVVLSSESVSQVANLERVMETTEQLIRRSRAVVAQSQELRLQSREYRVQSEASRLASEDLSAVPVKELVPLLVEDDADYAFFVKRAFGNQALPFPLPVLGNGEEAIAYLAGTGKYRDRSRYPIPTLMLLDLHLPRVDGFEVLRWIRSTPPPDCRSWWSSCSRRRRSGRISIARCSSARTATTTSRWA